MPCKIGFESVESLVSKELSRTGAPLLVTVITSQAPLPLGTAEKFAASRDSADIYYCLEFSQGPGTPGPISAMSRTMASRSLRKSQQLAVLNLGKSRLHEKGGLRPLLIKWMGCVVSGPPLWESLMEAGFPKANHRNLVGFPNDPGTQKCCATDFCFVPLSD